MKYFFCLLLVGTIVSTHAQEDNAPRNQLSINFFHLMEENIGFPLDPWVSQVNFAPEAYYRRFWWKGLYSGLHLQVIHSPKTTFLGTRFYDNLMAPQPNLIWMLNEYLTLGYEWSHDWNRIRILGRTEAFGGLGQGRYWSRGSGSSEKISNNSQYLGVRLGLGGQLRLWEKLWLGVETQWMYNFLEIEYYDFFTAPVQVQFQRRLFAPIAEISLNWKW